MDRLLPLTMNQNIFNPLGLRVCLWNERSTWRFKLDDFFWKSVNFSSLHYLFCMKHVTWISSQKFGEGKTAWNSSRFICYCQTRSLPLRHPAPHPHAGRKALVTIDDKWTVHWFPLFGLFLLCQLCQMHSMNQKCWLNIYPRCLGSFCVTAFTFECLLIPQKWLTSDWLRHHIQHEGMGWLFLCFCVLDQRQRGRSDSCHK